MARARASASVPFGEGRTPTRIFHEGCFTSSLATARSVSRLAASISLPALNAIARDTSIASKPLLGFTVTRGWDGPGA